MSIYSQLENLSEVERNFLLTKQIQDEKTPDEWLNFFNTLKAVDQSGDKKRGRHFGFGCLGGFLGLTALIISFPLVTFISQSYSGIIGAAAFLTAFIVVGAFTAWAIYSYVKYSKLKKYDIDSNALNTRVLPMLMILREDMKPNDKIKLRLDLRGFELPEKYINQSDDYGSGRYRSIIAFYYRDPWIDGEATLGDGTRIIWHIQDLVKHIKKIKYRKGKRKSKSKHRTFLYFQIGMPRKKHRLPARLKLKGNEGKLLTKRSGAYHWMSVKKTVKHSPGQQFTPNDFVNAIASAYVRATPQRRN